MTSIIFSFVASKHLVAAAKVFLLVTQEFPQIPFKPLHRVTKEPTVEKVQFSPSPDGAKAIGDLFVPKAAFGIVKKTNKYPAIIVAMGVKTSEKDRPILLEFCETLSRLDYVVLWPRSVDLENDVIKFEEPKTFIDAYNFLEERKEVDKDRISYVGFSVGSSLSLVAAEEEEINTKVRSIVFFGGYYNMLNYLSSLSTKTIVSDDKEIKWKPHESAINQAEEILEKESLTLAQFGKEESLDPNLINKLLRFSPDQNIDSLKAKIFILHEKSDSFVPYTESIKLKQALENKEIPVVYYQANLFEHVQPKKPLTYETGKEILGLFGFLHKVFMYL